MSDEINPVLIVTSLVDFLYFFPPLMNKKILGKLEIYKILEKRKLQEKNIKHDGAYDVRTKDPHSPSTITTKCYCGMIYPLKITVLHN